MVYLKTKVTCYHCKKQVEKTEASVFQAPLGGPSWECFNCFKKSRQILGEDGIKLDLYCERCNYRFKSKKAICPYCNETNTLSKGNVTMKDLL